jgi:uroporphyrinogen-III decarboxylase
MTGREKLLAAFTAEGTGAIGVVAAYDSLFLRDHYAALTTIPWWDSTQTGRVARDCHARSGLEWFTVSACDSRSERGRGRFEERRDGVWRVDIETGKETRLREPTPSGTNTECAHSRHSSMNSLPTTREQIDAMIPLETAFDRTRFLAEGRQDAAADVRESPDLLAYSHILSPLWTLYSFLGYEDMMILLAQSPDLAIHAAQRILENTLQHISMIAALGAEAVWIEECLTDQISPDVFRQINLPILRRCTEAIREHGMKSIYYYCGDPWKRLDAIIDAGADGIHFEESKKGFSIQIEDIVEAAGRRCVVFGNLDAIGVLQDGSEDMLRAEICRQLRAGRKNGGRFIMSTGSPITPGTPVQKVRRYADIVSEVAGRSV